MKQYGILLIGCGHIGEAHIADIYYRENIRIIAVVDTDIEKAKMFQRKYAAVYCSTDYHDYLFRNDVDIVICATYVDTHLTILKDCIMAKKHLLCEKPIAANPEDGGEFYNLVKHADIKVLPAHILRYNRSYQTIKRLINDGAIGQFQMARMIQNHHCKDWQRYYRLLQDCTPILDCGVHYFDVLQWITGQKITQVSGIGTIVGNDIGRCPYNYGIANLWLSDGSVGYYEAGWSETLASCNVKEFIGSEDRITLTLKSFRASNTEEGDLIELYCKNGNQYHTINVHATYKPMWEQLSGLIAMIEGRMADAPSFDELYSAFLVSIAADRAIRDNCIVAVGNGMK